MAIDALGATASTPAASGTSSCANNPLSLFVTILVTLVNQRLEAERDRRVLESQQQDGDDNGDFDVVVVGGGTAGCVVAARLSEQCGLRVLLLERGGTEPREARVPAFMSFIAATNVWEQLDAVPEPTNCNGTGCVFTVTSLLGGGASINGMLYVRGSSVDYDTWAAAVGDDSWNYTSLLPVFKRSENNLSPSTAADTHFHARGGPQPVSWAPYRFPVEAPLSSAFQWAGLSPRKDVNAEGQLGYSSLQTTTGGGERWSTYRSFLRPALQRGNLRVVTYATARRVLFEDAAANATDARPRAVGVEYSDAAGKVHVARARKQVVLTAGTLHSPHLLLLSGIGPADHLQSLNISVVADVPSVGENLQDHPRTVGVVYDCKSSLCPSSWPARVRDLAEYERSRNGPLSATLSQRGVFVRTSVDPPPPAGQGAPAKQPDLQIFVAGTYHDADGCANGGNWRPNRVSMLPTVLHPRSLGSVRLASSDPLAGPRVRFGFFSDEDGHDIDVVLDGFRLALSLEPALSKLGLSLNRDPSLAPDCAGLDFGSDAHSRCVMRTTTGTTWHYVGTCRMGRDNDTAAVVDSKLRVMGVRGLRVADASVLPTISGNTNGPTIMVAERAADLIKEDLAKEDSSEDAVADDYDEDPVADLIKELPKD